MKTKKVVCIDYYGYIVYEDEDDTPAMYSHFIRKVIWDEDSKDFENSAFPASSFAKFVSKLEFLNMEDGYSYCFEIPILLEAKLRDTNGRNNIWRERRTFENLSKYFTPIKLGEHSTEIPMLKTESVNEYLDRRCNIIRDNAR